MMTNEQLQEVERLGGLMFSSHQIATIMGLDPEAVLCDDLFQQHRLRGRLLREADVRRSVFELAVAGSAPAQALAKQFIDQARVAAI